jgi:hypothetical protein
MDEAKSALESVGVAINDINGNVRPVGEILKDLASRWSSLSESQKQNIGVTVAGNAVAV